MHLKVVGDMVLAVKTMHNVSPDLVPKIDMRVVADMVPHTKVVTHHVPLHRAAPHCIPPVRDPRESS